MRRRERWSACARRYDICRSRMPATDGVQVVEIDDVIPEAVSGPDRGRDHVGQDGLVLHAASPRGGCDVGDELRRLQPRRVSIQRPERVRAVAADGAAAAAAVLVLREGRRAVQAAAADSPGPVHAERRGRAVPQPARRLLPAALQRALLRQRQRRRHASSSTRRTTRCRSSNRSNTRASSKFTVARQVSPKKGRMVGFDGRHYHASMHPVQSSHRIAIAFSFV